MREEDEKRMRRMTSVKIGHNAACALSGARESARSHVRESARVGCARMFILVEDKSRWRVCVRCLLTNY